MGDNINKIIPTSNYEKIVHENFPQIGKKSLVDFSIDDLNETEILPTNCDLNTLSSLEFTIDPSSTHFLDLGSFEIDFKLRIIDDAGGREGVDADSQVYFINNIIQTIFVSRRCWMNGVPVENEYYGAHLSYLRQLLDTPNYVVENRGRIMGAFPINSNSVASDINVAHMANMVKRKEFSKGDWIHLRGPLNLAISTSDNWLLDRVSVKLALELARPNFALNVVGGHAFRYEIRSPKLIVTRVKPTTSAFLNVYNSLLNGTPLDYLFKRHVTHTEIFASGQNTLTVNRPFQSKIPGKIYVFMSKQSGVNGSYTSDPFYYERNHMINYKCVIDGVTIIDRDVDDNAVVSYHDSMLKHGNNMTFIDYEVFKKGGFVLVFQTGYSSEIGVEKVGNLQIKLRMDRNLNENYTVFTVGEIFSTFEINTDRSVSTHYAY